MNKVSVKEAFLRRKCPSLGEGFFPSERASFLQIRLPPEKGNPRRFWYSPDFRLVAPRHCSSRGFWPELRVGSGFLTCWRLSSVYATSHFLSFEIRPMFSRCPASLSTAIFRCFTCNSSLLHTELSFASWVTCLDKLCMYRHFGTAARVTPLGVERGCCPQRGPHLQVEISPLVELLPDQASTRGTRLIFLESPFALQGLV